MVKFRLASSWPVLLIALAVFSAAGLLAWSTLVSPTNAYLPAAAPAYWIVYPVPGDIHLHCNFEIDTLFHRAFHLDAIPHQATLHVRALRSCRVLLNDHPLVLHGSAPAWKCEAIADASTDLRLGDNQITATVTNSSGPPALWLWLEYSDSQSRAGSGGGVISDTSWDCSCAGATVCPAMLAQAPIPGRAYDPLSQAHSVSQAMPLVRIRLEVFGLVAVVLVLIGYFVLGRRVVPPDILQRKWRWLLLAALLLAAALWSTLFIHNLSWLADNDGFDAKGHLDYIQYLQIHHAIPLADQGWEMYQAPLYYILSAIMLTIAGISPNLNTITPAGVMLLRGLNLLLGIVNLWFLLACLRLIFPLNPRRQLIGFILGACLPMQLYLFQFPTNEVLATTAATAVVFFCLRALVAPRWRAGNYLLLGIGLGVAMLAKVSGLLLIVPVIAAIITRIFQPPSPEELRHAPTGKSGWGFFREMLPRRNVLQDVSVPKPLPPSFITEPRRFSFFQAASSIILPLLIALVLSGWYYGRVWVHFGTPIVGNWNSDSGMLWWQDPGYRTFAAYSRFGRSLTQPIYASFNGVWDGLYSTLWGDAFCAGNKLITGPPWSYDLIVVGTLFAVLPTLAIFLGSLAAIIRFIRKPTAKWVLLLGLAFTVLLAIISMTLTVPSYAQAKAFYGLVALVPLCALAGLGLDLLGGRWPLWRGLLLIGLLTWAFTAVAAYWADPSDPRVLVSLAVKLDNGGFHDVAVARTQAALILDPYDQATRLALIHILRARNPDDPLIDQLLDVDPKDPLTNKTSGNREFDLALGNARASALHLQRMHHFLKAGDTTHAIAEIQLAAQLDPDSLDILDMYNSAAALNREAGRPDQAIACLRQAIRMVPYLSQFHAELADVYIQTRQFDLANQQRNYARQALAARRAFLDHINAN